MNIGEQHEEKEEEFRDTLWALVAPLMNQYGHNEIATALRLNHAQMKEQRLPFISQNSQNHATFIEYPLPMAPPSTGSLCSGIHMQKWLYGKNQWIAAAEMQPLISLLMGG